MAARFPHAEKNLDSKEQSFNFYIGLGKYETRTKEVVVPESIFNKIHAKSKELRLQNLARIDYYTGARFTNAQLDDVFLDCKKLEATFNEKQVQKYIKYIEDLCTEAIKKKIELHVIGL